MRLSIFFQHKQSKKKGTKSFGPDPAPVSNINVLEEELMSKINANVKLNEMVREDILKLFNCNIN